MPENHGFEHVVVGGRALLRCQVCDATGEPWEWPLARRYQHARMHAGIPDAVKAEAKLEKVRQEIARAHAHRDRRVILPTRRCANPFCSEVFQPRRSTACYCSDACRVAVHRARHTTRGSS
jgi:hypothetical protein